MTSLICNFKENVKKRKRKLFYINGVYVKIKIKYKTLL